jgi:Cell Wall Hydrolase
MGRLPAGLSAPASLWALRMRALPGSIRLAFLVSTTLVGGFAALFAMDTGGTRATRVLGEDLRGHGKGAALLSAGRTRVTQASVFAMPTMDGPAETGSIATPASLGLSDMRGTEDDALYEPALPGDPVRLGSSGEHEPDVAWPGVERGRKGDRWQGREPAELVLAPEVSGYAAQSDWFFPAEGAPPLTRLSRRLEPPAGPLYDGFTRKRPSSILSAALIRAPGAARPAGSDLDGAVPLDARIARTGGTSPTVASPDLASLDARTTGVETASPTVVAAPAEDDPLPTITLASVRPSFDPNADEAVGPVEPDEGLTPAQKKGRLAGLPGLDDGVARPLSLPPVGYTKAQNCLATAIYFEARSESEKGQIAVAQVIVNRVRSPYYPKNVCDVVYQGASERRYGGCQFSFACDRIRDRVRNQGAFSDALSVAQRVLDAEVWLPEIGNATHYHATYVKPRWIRDMVEKDRIGRHIFYRVRWWA